MSAAATIAPVALTMGEPAGIGGELTLAAWLRRPSHGVPFYVHDDPSRLAGLARRLGLTVPIRAIDRPGQAVDVFSSALPVRPLSIAVTGVPGRPSKATAAAVIQSLDRAIDDAMAGTASAIVTNPIQKAPLLQGGFPHPGHTEYLAVRTGADAATMMLVCPHLRVVPVTVHIPLSEVARTLSTERIISSGLAAAASLRKDFGIDNPRLAVAGLNPHAGEDGALGAEDRDIVAPAVTFLQSLGILAFGPLPADTMFHEAARTRYDVALCMYHDQALIPLKTLGFADGVNVTLGLPIVRTSPDHGTALDIAGRGIADPTSLCEAIRLAAGIAARRHASIERVA